MTQKLLFLDIDGCLNSYKTRILYGHEKSIETLDPIALDLIRKIVLETDCVICLSSDWRLDHDFMELGKQLDLPILYETNHDQEGTRAYQIQEVLDAVNPSEYAIIDDEEYKGEFDGMNWVNIADEDGFGYKDYLLVMNFLK
jgi:hypothetical protein